MKYRAEIDGLRALAVMPVILFHAGILGFGGGFVGVDIFFVISGYLITTIIIDEKIKNEFSLAGFYERRFRRIFPALFLMMAICIPIAWAMMQPRQLQDFAESVGTVAVFLSNQLFLSERGYFDTASEFKPLLHTWSLAIEEQYYILFPIFVGLVINKGKKLTTIAIAVTCILSFVLSHWLVITKPDAAFFILPSRWWELAVGSLCALHILWKGNPKGNDYLGALGTLLIILSVTLLDKNSLFPGINALPPTIGAALIILFGTKETVIGRTLAHRALSGIGLVSYSAYLIHYPIFSFWRIGSLNAPSQASFLALTALSLTLAWFSWRFVEKPFREKNLISRKTIFLAAGFCSAIFFTFGLIGHYSGGFRSNNGNILPVQNDVPRMVDSNCHFHSSHLSPKTTDRFELCAKKYGKAIVILGDSHAMDLYNAIAYNSNYPFVFGLSQAGCRPHNTENKECHYGDFKNFLSEKHGKIHAVIYNQAGFYLVKDTTGADGSRDIFGQSNLATYLPNEIFIQKVSDYLTELSQHSKVIWLGPWIEPHLNVSALNKYSTNCQHIEIDSPGKTEKTFRHLDNFINDNLHQKNNLKYISIIEIINFDIKTDLFNCSGVFWRDGDHWSELGMQRFGQRLLGLIDSL
ncbi:MAG: hypothetical protein RIR18_1746 [Pseudomonadota bacterium]|jgi:peptidoglycan/LPS O-acetylase OafA/YrhL